MFTNQFLGSAILRELNSVGERQRQEQLASGPVSIATMTGFHTSLLKSLDTSLATMTTSLHTSLLKSLDTSLAVMTTEFHLLFRSMDTSLEMFTRSITEVFTHSIATTFAPGNPFVDMNIILHQKYSEGERAAALERTVKHISQRWNTPNPVIKDALDRCALDQRAKVGTIKREKLQAALMLALGERRQAQAHRFGRDWLTDEDGKKILVVPENLGVCFYWRWLVDRTIRIAEEDLLMDYPTSSLPLEEDDSPILEANFCETAADPLQIVIEHEQRQADRECVRTLFDLATPRQKELLILLKEGYKIADAAQQMHIQPSAARCLLSQLRHRAMLKVPATYGTFKQAQRVTRSKAIRGVVTQKQ